MKQRLLDLFYIFLGTCIVCFILYIRVFRDALPTYLQQNLFERGHYFSLLIYLILFLLFFYFSILLIRILLHELYKIVEMPQSNKVLDRFGKIGKLWSKSLEELGFFIINLPFINTRFSKWLERLGKFCSDHFSSLKKIMYIIIITHILPKSIFLGAFIVDVMVFHKFEYVYKVSFLMLIPLIETFLHYFISIFCEVNLRQINEMITIHGTTTGNQIIAESYFFHKFMQNHKEKFKLKSDNYPLDEEDFIADFTEQYKNMEKDFDLTSVLDMFHNLTIPIAEFEFFYRACKNSLLGYFHCSFFLGYASIWAYMLVYCW